jgi:NADH-quinone oxidoreductase subunit L
MGGLAKQLPITYWTFLVGAAAIAGIPPLAGFFSKDEILWRTWAAGHWILWTVGILTALLTATYMFRLVFLTFWGERRPAAAAVDAHGHGVGAAHDSHDHHSGSARHGAQPSHSASAHDPHPAPPAHGMSHLHDAPPAMAIALVVLALGSVVAGFVGVPAALGGGNAIEHYLHPSFVALGGATETHGADSGEAALAHGETADTAAEGASPIQIGEHAAGADHVAIERTLMLVSTVVALTGIGLAWFFFVRRPQAAESVAARAAPVHRLLLNKYYVDELYDSAVVQPIKRTSEGVLWKVVDAGVIDGAVNGAGTFVSGASSLLRQLQTGSVRVYAVSLVFGVVAVLGYYLWRFVALVAQRGV